jgi:hypothetical protein
MKKSILSLFFFIAVLTGISAQSVTVYDAYNANKTVDAKNVSSSIANNLQWNFSLLNRGAFVFTYERKLNEYLGVEIGAGPTLFKDPFFDLFNDEIDIFGGYNSKNKMGLFLSGAAKIYPKQMTDFEGFYVAPTFRFRSYKSESTAIDYASSAEVSDKYTLSYSMKDMAFIVGYQYEGWSEIMWNFYAGFVWTDTKYDWIELTYDTHQYSVQKIHDSGPGILIGASIGFTF